ncbi:MAG: hypothetical protein KGR48_05590 [Alphaproteobacteria bacterium]|nr:hypothetical protein [Alphaproteobacteria bacterium]MDE2072802.1 hypothetical protein [Alphaproteobacteria bacterium]MDE2351152.1 hypothetical protein [Alphaproteobacteria bacterium]
MRMLVAEVLPGGFLAIGALFWLWRAGYTTNVSALLVAAALLQAGPILAVANEQSLWLAAGVLAVACSAVAFAERADPRRIMVFGGSLAAIQLIDPLGGFLAASLLPATLMIGGGHEDRQRQAGLYVILMFLPLITAGLLLYLALTHHPAPALLLGQQNAAGLTRLPPGLGWRLMPALSLAAVLAVPIWANRVWRSRLREDAAMRAVAAVALAVIAAVALAACLSVVRAPATLMSTAAPIMVAALGLRPVPPARTGAATAATCLALSWSCAFGASLLR